MKKKSIKTYQIPTIGPTSFFFPEEIIVSAKQEKNLVKVVYMPKKKDELPRRF